MRGKIARKGPGSSCHIGIGRIEQHFRRKGDRPLLEMQHARFLSVTVKSIVKGKTTGTRRGRQVPLSNLKGMARIRVRQNGAAFGSVPFFPSCPFPPFAIPLPPPALCSLCGLCGYPLPASLPPTGFACGTTELFLPLLPPHHLRKRLHAVIAPLRLPLLPGGNQIPQATGHFPRQQVLPHAGRATPVVVHRIQGAGPIGASAEIGGVPAHGGPLTPSPPGGSPASAAAGIPGRCSG